MSMREVHVISEGVVMADLYGAKPSVVIWNRTARGGIPQAFDENVGGRLVALAHREIQNQLCVALDRDERVAVAKVLIVFGARRAFPSCR